MDFQISNCRNRQCRFCMIRTTLCVRLSPNQSTARRLLSLRATCEARRSRFVTSLARSQTGFCLPLIETLARAGVPLKRIIVLIATGLHRPNLGAELEELIGDAWVLQNVQIENHYARNDDEHVLLGRTGGRLIVASECSEGLGSAEFVESQRRLLRLGPEAFLRLGHVSNPHPSEESTSPGTDGGRT